MTQIHDSLLSLSVDINKLSFLEKNPRQGDIEAVANSYKQFGQRKPIVATKDNVVIAGNHQLAAARSLGWESIAVLYVDDDELTAKAFALADNRTSELGSYDDDLLADLLSEVSSVPELMDSTGFSEDDLFDLIGFDEIEEKDEIPEVPKEAKTKLGDKYQLGNHILICGDSTNLDLYKQECHIAFTDPPYGVDYEGRTADKLTIKNDLRADLHDLLFDTFTNISLITKGNVFICSPFKNIDIFSTIFYDVFYYSSLIVWKKDKPVMTRGHFNSFYELIFYGWNKNSKSSYIGDNKETDVWNFDRPVQNKLHPTSKPVDLVKKAILLSSKANEWVLDTFAGSGSTLIAAEETKRKCYAIELDPAYCDVIIERWENLTGNKAELIESFEGDNDK